MKKFIQIVIIVFLIFGIACNNEPKNSTGGIPKIEFAQTDFDFGAIKQGEMVAHRFVFKNNGNGDLLIKNVVPGCGCTVASYPHDAVHPGEESFIEATFNSEGYRGLIVKDVQVFSNSEPARIKLTISAAVEENQ